MSSPLARRGSGVRIWIEDDRYTTNLCRVGIALATGMKNEEIDVDRQMRPNLLTSKRMFLTKVQNRAGVEGAGGWS